MREGKVRVYWNYFAIQAMWLFVGAVVAIVGFITFLWGTIASDTLTIPLVGVVMLLIGISRSLTSWKNLIE